MLYLSAPQFPGWEWKNREVGYQVKGDRSSDTISNSEKGQGVRLTGSLQGKGGRLAPSIKDTEISLSLWGFVLLLLLKHWFSQLPFWLGTLALAWESIFLAPHKPQRPWWRARGWGMGTVRSQLITCKSLCCCCFLIIAQVMNHCFCLL